MYGLELTKRLHKPQVSHTTELRIRAYQIFMSSPESHHREANKYASRPNANSYIRNSLIYLRTHVRPLELAFLAYSPRWGIIYAINSSVCIINNSVDASVIHYTVKVIVHAGIRSITCSCVITALSSLVNINVVGKSI